jgi:phospholipase C
VAFPDPAVPAGELGFTFDRSGYRVPAIMVSPWVESGSVYNEDYRHTSLIATLRKIWDLGEPLTGRDATARTFEQVFSRDQPRDPQTWPDFPAQPVPEWTADPEVIGRAVSGLAKKMIPCLIAHAKEIGVPLPPEANDPNAELPPAMLVQLLRETALHYFPALAT